MPSPLFSSQRTLLIVAAALLVSSQLPAAIATVLAKPLWIVVSTATAPLRTPIYQLSLRAQDPPTVPIPEDGPRTLEDYELALRMSHARIERLQQEVASLHRQLQVTAAVKDLNLRPRPLQVTGYADTGVKPILTLAGGSNDGIAAGMTVVWNDLVVGRIIEPVGPATCRAELITAHDAGLRVNITSPPYAAEQFQHEDYTLRITPGPDRLHFTTQVELDLPVRIGDPVRLADELHYHDARGLLIGEITDITEYIPDPTLLKQVIIRPKVDLRHLPLVAVLLPDTQND